MDTREDVASPGESSITVAEETQHSSAKLFSDANERLLHLLRFKVPQKRTEVVWLVLRVTYVRIAQFFLSLISSVALASYFVSTTTSYAAELLHWEILIGCLACFYSLAMIALGFRCMSHGPVEALNVKAFATM